MLMRLPRFCSASGMFAEARVDCFYTTMQKRCTSLLRRVRSSSNGVLKAFADRIDCQYLNHCCMIHMLANRSCPNLSPEGYISVQDILQHRLCKGKYNLTDIQRVVTTNDKQRFKLRNNPSTNVLEIKAHQGHTIKQIDESGLTPILELKYKTVVHGTYIKCWSNIKAHGLSCMQRKHIHLAKGTLQDPDIISGIRKDVQVYVFIDLAKALTDGIKFYESDNGVILTGGNERGYLETKYFSKVIQVDTGKRCSPVAVRMEAAAQPARLNARKIHVSGFPTYTQPQDLTRVFASYGTVKVDKINNRFAVLTFTSEDEAQEALDDTNKVNIYGEFLTVSPYTGRAETATPKQPTTPKRDFVRSKRKGEIIDPKLIALTGDFHTQLDNILHAVRLTQEEVTSLSELYMDLEFVLQQQWPGCIALPFGSITTGLGIKNSDADCFIQVPPLFRHLGANFVNKAKKLLQQHPHIFAEILAIPRANTPIVKFFHIPTQTNCDVTFKTPLGAQNSKLIAFLLHADPRLIPMAVVLKYWAKVHGFTGTGKLTNYALTMLIIFYLQQPPVSILPSVEWLQRDPANDIIVDHWNTGFMHSHELLPTSTNNTQSISELLGGFFQYYTTFNFEELVVCPYTGYPMKKELFRDLNNLPPEFQRYKINIMENLVLPLRVSTSICVQDPIEQSHNVASAITSRLAAEIKAYFKFAATAYEKEKNKQFASFFKTILLQKPKLPRKGCPEFRVVMYPHILQCIANADWKSVVREVMMQMFEGMCKIPLTKVEEAPKPDAKKQREKYTGTIVKAIWKRKQFNRLYSLSKLDFLSKQTRITEEILSADKESFKVNFQLMMTFSADTRNVSVMIKLLEGEPSFFIEFGKFFITSLQNWYVTLLKPYFRPSKKPQEDKAPVANGSKSEDECPQIENNEEDLDIKVEMVLPREIDESELATDISNTTIDTNDLNVTTDSGDTKDLNDTKDSNDTKTSTQ